MWDQNKNNIPDTIYLSLPKFNEQTNQIILKGEGIWTTSLNPYVSSIDEIFNKWEESYDKALGLIKAYPDLKGILGLSAVATPAAAAAVTDKELIGKVYVTGMGISSTMKNYVLEGSCPKFLLWNTTNYSLKANSS